MQPPDTINSSAPAAPLAAAERVEYLDVYRGIACLLVFFYHTGVNLSLFGVPFYGYNGVHLFFVLSGYLMLGKFLPALRGSELQPSVRDYLRRRFLRIYPAYFVCLIAFVVLRIVSGTNQPEGLNVLLRGGLIFNYVDRYDYFSINAVFWSLAVEMQFYLILPLVVWLTLRILPPGQRRVFTFSMLFLTVGMLSRVFECAFVDHTHPNAIAVIRFKWVTSHLDLFGAGMLLRVIGEVCARRTLRWPGALVGSLGSAVLLALVALWTRKSGQWQESTDLLFTTFGPTVTCLAFALMLGVTRASALRKSLFFRCKALAWTGQISYSMYLYHVGIFYAFYKICKPESWGLSWGTMTFLTGLCCLPIALLVSWLSYLCFEAPFHRPQPSASRYEPSCGR